MKTTVIDVMTREVVVAREEAGFKETVEVMRQGRVSALPVLDSGNPPEDPAGKRRSSHSVPSQRKGESHV